MHRMKNFLSAYDSRLSLMTEDRPEEITDPDHPKPNDQKVRYL